MVKIMENPIKMDDLGVPLFLETPFGCCPFDPKKLKIMKETWRYLAIHDGLPFLP